MENNSGKVAILMATYNGSKYLKQQLNSILKQTYQNFVLFISDDHSSDNTLDIIHDYEAVYPQKILLIKNDHNVRGVKTNFANLISYVKANCLHDFDYFMLSDQDDFWKSNKIAISIQPLIYQQLPILVHTDLTVVDQNLKLINCSFVKMGKINGFNHKLQRLLVQNNVTGCTMAWNKALMKIIQPDFTKAIMHDWFIALIANCSGQIIFIPQATVLYRQHKDNLVGIKNVLVDVTKKLSNFKQVKQSVNATFIQAQFLQDNYNLNSQSTEILNNYLNIMKHQHKIVRISIILKNGYLQFGLIKILGEMVFI